MKIDHREQRHGATVIDPYYWIRDKSNPEVIKHLEAENAYTAELTKSLKPLEDTLYNEMLGRIKQTDLTVPVRRGNNYYYSRTEEGKQYPIQCRRRGSMDAAEEILLDLNELAKGHSYLGLGAFVLSDDENLLAYSTDTTGFRQYSLHVKDLRAGSTLTDTMERVTSVQWAADNKTLFLTTENEITKRSNLLLRHKLGETQYEPMYEEKDELFTIRAARTLDKKFLIFPIRSTDTWEALYMSAASPQSKPKVFLNREKKHKYDVDHREGLFYIRTNKDAKNFRVVTATAADPSPEHCPALPVSVSRVLPRRSDRRVPQSGGRGTLP